MLRLFCSFIIAVSSLQVDCEDGKRGGCQHTCYQNQCRCPQCWTLDENGLDCVPEQDKVKINCSPSGIAVLVSECVIPGERTLGLRDFNVSFCRKKSASDIWPYKRGILGPKVLVHNYLTISKMTEIDQINLNLIILRR